MKKNRRRLPEYNWENRENLKSDILYTKYIVNILSQEKDKRENEEGGKWKEQYNRNLNYYINRVDELNKQRQNEIAIALSKPKEDKSYIRNARFLRDE